MRSPLNLSEAQVRALISAGSFTTTRPVATTSKPRETLAGQIATMQMGTLLPPEGQGGFTLAELPPVAKAPRVSPVSPPVSSRAPQPKGTQPGTGPIAQPAAPKPVPAAPVSHVTTPAAKVPGVPKPPGAPMFVPHPPGPIPTGSPGPSTSNGGSRQGSGETTQTPQEPCEPTQGGAAVQSASQYIQGPCGQSSCCACATAMIAIVAEISTTAQAAITAITAMAGMN